MLSHYFLETPLFELSHNEVSGTLAYNNLPGHIKQQPSLNQFKSSVN